MDENYSANKIPDFIEQLASNSPVPGGGGTAALVGALAVSLGAMVASLTVGKEKYKDVETEMSACKLDAQELAVDLIELIDKDAEAFAPLAEAYRLPSKTEDEKQQKNYAMQYALEGAALVPNEIMRKCARAIELIEVFADKGSVMALSDAASAAELAKAALRTAWLNVLVNTKLFDDEVMAARIESEGEAMIMEYCARADAVYDRILGSLRIDRNRV